MKPLTDPFSALPARPRWDRLRKLILRLGLIRATVLLTLGVWAGSLVVTAATIGVLGQGSMSVGLTVASICTLLVSSPVGYVVLKLLYRLERSHLRISQLAVTDELTTCYNRRHFMELAETEWLRARRYATPLALILLDADHFKHINDTHGHQCGDLLLREIALTCRATLRSTDILARFGGEELIVLLPQTDLAGALIMAERMRRQVQGLVLPWRGRKIEATVSIGVAALHAGIESIDGLIHDADVALYDAKRGGRNRVSSQVCAEVQLQPS